MRRGTPPPDWAEPGERVPQVGRAVVRGLGLARCGSPLLYRVSSGDWRCRRCRRSGNSSFPKWGCCSTSNGMPMCIGACRRVVAHALSGTHRCHRQHHLCVGLRPHAWLDVASPRWHRSGRTPGYHVVARWRIVPTAGSRSRLSSLGSQALGLLTTRPERRGAAPSSMQYRPMSLRH